jgi:hypothetical protein
MEFIGRVDDYRESSSSWPPPAHACSSSSNTAVVVAATTAAGATGNATGPDTGENNVANEGKRQMDQTSPGLWSSHHHPPQPQ